jgi:hypothetical protein
MTRQPKVCLIVKYDKVRHAHIYEAIKVPIHRERERERE